MISRNLIKFGKNSYVISLPKHWVDSNKLAKGSELWVEEKKNNLIVYCNYEENENAKIKIINTDQPSCSVARELVTSYINDYSEIKIIGSKTNSHIKEIRHITDKLVALEIMEQIDSKVVLKDFLNIKDISMDSIIHRMDIIVRSIFIDLIGNIFEGKKFDLMERDKDVNRLYFLGSKILNKLLNNPGLSKVIKVEIKDVIHIWRFIEAMERIADILKSMQEVDFSKTKNKLLGKVKETLAAVQEEYLTSLKAFYKKDKLVANGLINNYPEMVKKCDELRNDKNLQAEGTHSTTIIEMVERMKVISQKILVVNYTTINVDE